MEAQKVEGCVSNPLNDSYLGRWLVRSFNRWLFAGFLFANPWLLLFECEAMELDGKERNDG